MLIIVEGMDNTGKSKLCQYLLDNLHPRFKSVVYHSTPDIDQYQRLFHIIHSTHQENTIVLCDRIGMFGEEIYGKVLRGKSVFDLGFEETFRTFLKAIYPKEILFIYCSNDEHSFGDKPEMKGVKENSNVLLKAYDLTLFAFHQMLDDCWENCSPLYTHHYSFTLDPNYEKLSNIHIIRRILKNEC